MISVIKSAELTQISRILMCYKIRDG